MEAINICSQLGTGTYVCGGAAIYELALPFATRMEITRVQETPEGDTFFPIVDWSNWELVQEEIHVGYSFLSYLRKVSVD